MATELEQLAADLDGSSEQIEAEELGKRGEPRTSKAPEPKQTLKLAAKQTSKPAPKTEKKEPTPLDVDFSLDFDPFEEASAELAGDRPSEEPKKKAAAKKKEPEPKDTDEEDDYEGNFPDFSKFETYDDDGTDGKPAKEGEEEEEPELEAGEEPEAGGEDEPEESSKFDLNKVLDEIKDLPTGSLRKTYLESRARLRQAEIQRDEYKRKAEENEQAAEQARQEYIDKISKPPEPSINEYEPYQKIISKYQDWRQRAVRRIRDGSVRERLGNDESALRAEAARIQTLSGAEFDAAQQKFEDKVRNSYGKSAEQVLDLAYEAAEFEIEAADVRKKFQKESEESAVELARKRFDDGTKKVTERVLKAFALPKDDIAKNPFSFNAYMTRLLNDEKSGDKAMSLLRDDMKAIHRVIVGPVPPDLKQYTAQSDREEAKRLFEEEYNKAAKQREEDLPMLAAMGLQAARYLPVLIKKLNDQGQLLRKRGGVSAPTKSAKAEAKKKRDEDDEDTIRRELDNAIDQIG